MKVFQIRAAGDGWQEINTEDKSIFGTPLVNFDIDLKLPTWNPPDFYVVNPRLKRGDFFGFLGTFGFYEEVMDDGACYLALGRVGEFLPISCDGASAYLLNVTNCINCLDADLSTWFLHPSTKQRLQITKFQFKKGRLPNGDIFKIPELSRSSVFVATDPDNPVGDDFYVSYHKGGHSGLRFEEVWGG